MQNRLQVNYSIFRGSLLIILYASNTISILFVSLISSVEAVDCVWGEYGKWTTCSANCGGGSRTRTRPEATTAENGGAPCSGSSIDTEVCNTEACQGIIILKAMQKRIINTCVVLK